MILEVCAGSHQSALNAHEGGAQRIELCEKLVLGGVTPRNDLIEVVLNDVSIPVFVLIRPRGGDFVYSNEEFKLMKKSILFCKKIGCKGIVSGVLKKDHAIDIERTTELVELTRPLSFTFHRAFDKVSDPMKELEKLIELGVDRILTSGQESTAENGIDLLKSLQKRANGRITILPGGGINPQNVQMFKENRFTEIHSSARQRDRDLSYYDGHSNLEILKELLQMIS